MKWSYFKVQNKTLVAFQRIRTVSVTEINYHTRKLTVFSIYFVISRCTESFNSLHYYKFCYFTSYKLSNDDTHWFLAFVFFRRLVGVGESKPVEVGLEPSEYLAVGCQTRPYLADADLFALKLDNATGHLEFSM